MRAQARSFDFGPQRICWMTQAVTDWMGDHGTLTRIQARLRRPNLVGDTNTVQGTVVRTYREGPDELFADLDVENVNQDNVVTASARATVKLPSRDSVVANSLLFAPEPEAAPGGIYT